MAVTETIALCAQGSISLIGVVSSINYATQSCVQIKRHGFRHWLEVGFEKVDRETEKD